MKLFKTFKKTSSCEVLGYLYSLTAPMNSIILLSLLPLLANPFLINGIHLKININVHAMTTWKNISWCLCPESQATHGVALTPGVGRSPSHGIAQTLGEKQLTSFPQYSCLGCACRFLTCM